MIKTYKRYSAARKAANGRPVVKIGSIKAIYCVIDGTEEATKLIEVAIVSGKGMITGHVTLELITGHVTLEHLDRLGNANHAQPGGLIPYTAFPPLGGSIKELNAILRHRDPKWAFQRVMTQPERDLMDRLLTRDKHPLAKAGTQEQRFVALHATQHQFAES
jgi:hypothetical protein